MTHRSRFGAGIAILLALAFTQPAPTFASTASPRAHTSARPVFDRARILPGQGGGEPSIAVDLSHTSSRGDIYVEAIGGWGSNPPKGDPKGAGPVVWHSYNDGRSWSKPVALDTVAADQATRGGDGDVIVDHLGHVITADLDVTYAWIQRSTDHGKTFNTGTATAPEDDRPWLSANGNTVYVAYHDFAAELPVVCTSTDDGKSFGACNPFTLTNPSTAIQCAENTIPARPLAVDPTDGSLNFLFSCSTASENLQNPPYGPLHDYYLAKSTDGGLTWTDYPVFTAATSGGRKPNYANIFSTLGIDSKGNYYVVMAGTSDDRNPVQHPFHVYLLTSRDHGKTWSKPKQVDPGPRGTHTEPHFVVTNPGNIDIAYYGTPATGEPNGYCGNTISSQVAPSPCKDGFARFDNPHPSPPLIPPPHWHVYLSQSHDALAAHPRFVTSQVEKPVIHVGEICTNGIVCGSSDRSLLDFLSVAVDCHGMAHVAYAGNTVSEEKQDFGDGTANIFESNQIGGSRLDPPAACQTARPASKPHRTKTTQAASNTSKSGAGHATVKGSATAAATLPATGSLPFGDLPLLVTATALLGVALRRHLLRRR